MNVFWEPILWETVAHLQTLIRLDSVNPPGNEMVVARYLDDVLRGAGMETWLDEPVAGRASLIARIRGTGAERPLLLMAHMDVVGVEKEKWTMQPFGAEILDGQIYGRGAIDDKGMLATNLETMLLVRRAIDAGAPLPTRDIIFLATSDEETGGVFGIDWVMENRRALIDAEFALNEGGRVRIVGGRTLYCAVQCAEKVPHNVTVTARGPGGHAAIPLEGNAIARLARALSAIHLHREPFALSPITHTFFRQLAAVWPEPEVRRAMRDVSADDPKRVARGARALKRIPSFDAVV
ncbi:MAG: M20/M25/M40 family metallo-hydrolase, partial [Gemmatimonadaceae bacterium]